MKTKLICFIILFMTSCNGNLVEPSERIEASLEYSKVEYLDFVSKESNSSNSFGVISITKDSIIVEATSRDKAFEDTKEAYKIISVYKSGPNLDYNISGGGEFKVRLDSTGQITSITFTAGSEMAFFNLK